MNLIITNIFLSLTDGKMFCGFQGSKPQISYCPLPLLFCGSINCSQHLGVDEGALNNPCDRTIMSSTCAMTMFMFSWDKYFAVIICAW